MSVCTFSSLSIPYTILPFLLCVQSHNLAIHPSFFYITSCLSVSYIDFGSTYYLDRWIDSQERVTSCLIQLLSNLSQSHTYIYLHHVFTLLNLSWSFLLCCILHSKLFCRLLQIKFQRNWKLSRVSYMTNLLVDNIDNSLIPGLQNGFNCVLTKYYNHNIYH